MVSYEEKSNLSDVYKMHSNCEIKENEVRFPAIYDPDPFRLNIVFGVIVLLCAAFRFYLLYTNNGLVLSQSNAGSNSIDAVSLIFFVIGVVMLFWKKTQYLYYAVADIENKSITLNTCSDSNIGSKSEKYFLTDIKHFVLQNSEILYGTKYDKKYYDFFRLYIKLNNNQKKVLIIEKKFLKSEPEKTEEIRSFIKEAASILKLEVVSEPLKNVKKNLTFAEIVQTFIFIASMMSVLKALYI